MLLIRCEGMKCYALIRCEGMKCCKRLSRKEYYALIRWEGMKIDS